MHIVIAGGTGFIGKKLVAELNAGNHRITLLIRRPSRAPSGTNITPVLWDGETQGSWSAFLDGADAVINLSGAGIADKRWTARRKREILESRVHTVRALITAMERAAKKPGVLVNSSAVGYYGDGGNERLSENAPAGKGFLAETCVKWEQAALEAEKIGVRTVLVRTGIVLDREGGVLAKMIPPFQFFAGGPLGPGTQWMPWIHRDDQVGVILHAMHKTDLSGPVNAVAPEAATMAEFCSELGRVMRRPSWAPVPAPVLKLIFGEMSQLFLEGANVVPARLLRSGYQFKYPGLHAALAEAVKKTGD